MIYEIFDFEIKFLDENLGRISGSNFEQYKLDSRDLRQ